MGDARTARVSMCSRMVAGTLDAAPRPRVRHRSPALPALRCTIAGASGCCTGIYECRGRHDAGSDHHRPARHRGHPRAHRHPGAPRPAARATLKPTPELHCVRASRACSGRTRAPGPRTARAHQGYVLEGPDSGRRGLRCAGRAASRRKQVDCGTLYALIRVHCTHDAAHRRQQWSVRAPNWPKPHVKQPFLMPNL